MTDNTIDGEVEELLQVYRKRILLEDDGLADIEAAQTIKNLMLKHKLADATEYKKYYDKKLAQEANKARLIKPGEIIPYTTIQGKDYVELKWLIDRLTADKEQNNEKAV